VPERTPEEVQLEIEQARDALASAVDQLTVRANPKRLADDAKTSIKAKAQTPVGMAVIGASGLLVVLLVVKRVRK
jgi:hypothetical protein